MAEVFAWPEGTCWVWTGTATASALVAYHENTQIQMVWGVENYRTLDSAYHNAWTGKRADIQVGALFTVDHLTIQKFFDAQTGVHIHYARVAGGASAGHYFYSGAIDSLALQGQAGGMYQWRLTYHANSWSAY